MSDGNLVGAILYLQGSDTIIHLYQDEEFLEAEINFAGDGYDQWMDLGETLMLREDTTQQNIKDWIEKWRRRTELIHASLYLESELADQSDD